MKALPILRVYMRGFFRTLTCNKLRYRTAWRQSRASKPSAWPNSSAPWLHFGPHQGISISWWVLFWAPYTWDPSILDPYSVPLIFESSREKFAGQRAAVYVACGARLSYECTVWPVSILAVSLFILPKTLRSARSSTIC